LCTLRMSAAKIMAIAVCCSSFSLKEYHKGHKGYTKDTKLISRQRRDGENVLSTVVWIKST
jgi:hypothetical protein